MDINRGFLVLVASGSLGFWLSATAATEPLLLTQSPRSSAGKSNHSYLDQLYPSGSRVVVASPARPREIKVLSEGLYAAGDPVLSYDGKRVIFVGRPAEGSDWQIYQARVDGGHPRAVTSIAGGAMDPALLPDGSVVYVSPIPKGLVGPPPQLYAQSLGGKPRQLTFGPAGAFDPTVLPEGRILFLSASRRDDLPGRAGLSLFTVNNDGTEIAAYACQHDTPARIRRPREVAGGRIAFLAAPPGDATGETLAEFVRTARPFLSRAKLFPTGSTPVRSVEPDGESLLVCAKNPQGNWAVYRVSGEGGIPATPCFEDAGWDCVDAIVVRPRTLPMGRLTNMDPAKKTGQILCLNANDTTYHTGVQRVALATRIRVLTESASGICRSLGEVPVQADGSFMAEVPADVPLGFEALDENGSVVRRLAPTIWVRAGENRSCVGCHASHSRVPHNHRPDAVRSPVPLLGVGPEDKLTQKSP